MRIDGTAHPDRRSLAGHTDDRHVTADQVDTFLHGDQPETAAVVSYGGHVEALAVVHHRKVELLALAAQRHCPLLRAAVEDAVTQPAQVRRE